MIFDINEEKIECIIYYMYCKLFIWVKKRRIFILYYIKKYILNGLRKYFIVRKKLFLCDYIYNFNCVGSYIK